MNTENMLENTKIPTSKVNLEGQSEFPAKESILNKNKDLWLKMKNKSLNMNTAKLIKNVSIVTNMDILPTNVKQTLRFVINVTKKDI